MTARRRPADSRLEGPQCSLRPTGSRVRAVSAVGLALVLLVAAVDAQPPAPRFRYARGVSVSGPGPQRLAVDVALLAHAQPLRYAGPQLVGGFDDLRVYDPAGLEVGYLLIPPAAPSARWEQGTMQPVLATKEESGFEVDLGRPLRVDRLRLHGLAPPFLKRLRLEGSGDRERWTVLVADGTVFDLPDERLRSVEVAFQPGELRYLRVTWDDRHSAVIATPRAVAARVAVPAESPEAVRVAVEFARRASEPGTSRFRVRLPGPHLPVVALHLQAGGGHLLRPVRVTAPQLSGAEVAPVGLGSHILRREVRADLVAADLRVPVSPSEGPDLDLAVEDGDNPAFELLRVEAELASLPWIYFESATGEPLTARWGDARLRAPHYDLEAVRAFAAAAPTAEARWGEVRDVQPAEVDAVPQGETLPATGAGIDPATFAYRRAIPSGPPGLSALLLDAAVLAHSATLADVRIAGSDGRQVPYLVERLDEPLSVDLDALAPLPDTPTPGGGQQSRYRLRLPYAGLPPARLVLSTPARVFERSVRLSVERPPRDPRAQPHREDVAAARWRHATSEERAPDLVLALPRVDTDTIEVIVDEGDNRALPLSRPRLLLPAYRLRFVRGDAASLTLLYGQPGLPGPRYDLALLAARVLGAAAHELSAAPEAVHEPATGSAAAATGTRVFWIVLLGAVAVLLAIIWRLLAAHGPTGGGASAP